MKKEDTIVKLIAERLNLLLPEDENEEVSLESVISYVDYKNRAIPSLEEIFAALQTIEDVSVVKNDHMIYFAGHHRTEGKVQPITQEDMDYAYKQYSKKFWERYKKTNE
jgi:hypothetical protein